MRRSAEKKRSGYLPLRLALFVVAGAALVTLVMWQAKISDKRQELDSLNAQIIAQDLRNEEIRKTVLSLETEEGLVEYAEKKAREDLDYAKPGERIFVDVGGGE